MKQNSKCTPIAAVLMAAAFTNAGLSQESPATAKLTTIHTFKQGVKPTGTIIMDQAGAIYGATSTGGAFEGGIVYQLTPPVAPGSGWTETVLHSFGNYPDGTEPLSTGLVFDTQGRLYGTTYAGGQYDFGTVFQLTPPVSSGGEWSEAVLYSFADGYDGAYPETGLVIDQNGVLYGTTFDGGDTVCAGYGCGVVFSLTPPAVDGGAWSEEDILAFPESGFNGYGPSGPLLMAGDGTLYGMNPGRTGYNGSFLYELKPPVSAGRAWRERVVEGFGAYIQPEGLTFGRQSALYGTTNAGGSSGGGWVYLLTPPARPGDDWPETVLYNFGAPGDGAVPIAGVVFGPKGQIYGTTSAGGANGFGTIYEMNRPTVSGGPWSETLLYSFANAGDGAAPADLVIDSSGALYGIAIGQNSPGTIFMFVP